MYRPYLTTGTRRLLEIARSPTVSSIELEKIVSELHERNNEFSTHALLEIGDLLQAAKEREWRARNEHRRVERECRELLGYFEWPSTDAPASVHGYVGDVFFYKKGLLSYVGYHVGHGGESSMTRKRILHCLFQNRLPNVDSREYMDEWSEPATPMRLKKLAETIAALTRNAKRRKDVDMTQAISDWEADLEYLYDTYYVGRFRFAWPSTR